MKGRFSITALLFSLLAGALPAAGPDSELIGVDGSRIKGSLADFTDGALIFDSPDFFAPSPLLLNQVLQVTLPARSATENTDHIATVTLTNGDILHGQLVTLDDHSIGLHTDYAGELTFRRSMVDKLDIQDLPSRIYSGPNGEADWVERSAKKWDVTRTELLAHGNGTISRMFNLPPKVHFSFDIAWRQNPRFHFLFFTDRIGAEKIQNGFDLSCQNRYVYLRRTKDERNVNILGTADVREFTQGKQAHLEIFANRETGLVRLMVNGRVVMDWTDPDLGGGVFGGIQFTNDDSSSLRISRIRITDWDGMVENPAPIGEEDPDEDEPKKQPAPEAAPTRIRLRNNDEIDGETTGIENGIVKMKTTFGDVEIPVARLRTFSLHTPEQRKDATQYEIPRLYANDVRAWFPDGGRITLRLKDIRDGRLLGSAQSFGDGTFDLSAFEKLDFNLYREGLDELRNEERW